MCILQARDQLKILVSKQKVYGYLDDQYPFGQLVCSSFCADEKNAVSLPLLLLTAVAQRPLIFTNFWYANSAQWERGSAFRSNLSLISADEVLLAVPIVLCCVRESVHQAQPFPNTRKTYMYKLISISFQTSGAKTNFTRCRCWQIVLYTSPAPTILEWKKTHFKVCTALLVGWSWVGVHGSLFIQFKRANQNSL